MENKITLSKEEKIKQLTRAMLAREEAMGFYLDELEAELNRIEEEDSEFIKQARGVRNEITEGLNAFEIMNLNRNKFYNMIRELKEAKE